jgi:hypothetical protein
VYFICRMFVAFSYTLVFSSLYFMFYVSPFPFFCSVIMSEMAERLGEVMYAGEDFTSIDSSSLSDSVALFAMSSESRVRFLSQIAYPSLVGTK